MPRSNHRSVLLVRRRRNISFLFEKYRPAERVFRKTSSKYRNSMSKFSLATGARPFSRSQRASDACSVIRTRVCNKIKINFYQRVRPRLNNEKYETQKLTGIDRREMCASFQILEKVRPARSLSSWRIEIKYLLNRLSPHASEVYVNLFTRKFVTYWLCRVPHTYEKSFSGLLYAYRQWIRR